MASQLQIELTKLKNAITQINTLAEKQVFQAMKVLVYEPSLEEVDVKKTEHKIDKLDVKIEDICQSVFALQQPVASDLRFIMSAMQMSNEIERIGDLALSIIKKSKNINKKHDLTSKFNIEELAKEIESITLKTSNCFETLNESTIGEIFILNNRIKHMSSDAIHNVVQEMKQNSKTIVSGTNLVIVLKHIERIAEHCTNIAESVYFMINAKIIKHEKFVE